jgi:hypothetical protein
MPSSSNNPCLSTPLGSFIRGSSLNSEFLNSYIFFAASIAVSIAASGCRFAGPNRRAV